MLYNNALLLALLLLFVSVSIFEFILLINKNRELKNTEKTRQILYETVEKISKTDNEDEIYSIFLKTIVALIPGATKGSILLKSDKNTFYYKEILGYREELKTFTLKEEETYLYRLNGFKETAIIKNPKQFDEKCTNTKTLDAFDKIDALDISCSISAPIYIDGRFIGMINADSEKPGYSYTEKDLNLMNQIKNELQLALKNAFAQNRLKYLANYDMLTGIMNRYSLKKEYNHQLKATHGAGQMFCLVMLDVDDFKLYNDTYGHSFGDRVLVHFSNILRNTVMEPDFIGRFAGDEFIIIYENSDINRSERKIQSLIKTVALEKIDGITIRFSYGICEVRPNSDMNFDKAIVLADDNMYQQKKKKKEKANTFYK